MTFAEKLTHAVERNNSLLCVGLDPRPGRFPPQVMAQPDPIFAFNKTITDATADLVCAYKPNIAFYEAQGLEGLAALRRTIEYIHEVTDVPVILDAKRGDIGSTAEAYAKAAFEVWGADAVTVTPYLGHDAVQPFTAYADRGVFVLCHTSSSGAMDLQTLAPDGRPVFLRMAEQALSWSEHSNVGLVIAATYPRALAAVRAMASDVWLLVPGIGAQGGDLAAALAAGLDIQGKGLIINVSRSIAQASDPRAEALSLRGLINDTRMRLRGPEFQKVWDDRAFLASNIFERRFLIHALYNLGVVRFGDFTLTSGLKSYIYLDLRLLVSDLTVMQQVAQSYIARLSELKFDRIAAIPYGALPIGIAVASKLGKPLVYPRKEPKTYGAQRLIEGNYQPGEQIVILDDVITTGATKLMAIEALEQVGLRVKDIVVLIDREQGGAEELTKRSYHVHAIFHLGEILDVLLADGFINEEQRRLASS